MIAQEMVQALGLKKCPILEENKAEMCPFYHEEAEKARYEMFRSLYDTCRTVIQIQIPRPLKLTKTDSMYDNKPETQKNFEWNR